MAYNGSLLLLTLKKAKHILKKNEGRAEEVFRIHKGRPMLGIAFQATLRQTWLIPSPNLSLTFSYT
jgi:hypothetical protein